MSKVVTTTVLPDVAGGSVTLGGTGDSVVVTGNDIRTNTLQDAGGNAVFTSNGSGVLSGVNSGFGGALNLLSTQTASGASSVSFTTQLTSTYDVYVFKFIDINPDSHDKNFTFQVNATDGADYNDSAITSTVFESEHYEDNSVARVRYEPNDDQAQGTAFQILAEGIGNGADESLAGVFHLFNPSNTTYVKHFYSRVNESDGANFTVDCYAAGYFNTTSAINAISFKFDSGNINAGTIKLYGVS